MIQKIKRLALITIASLSMLMPGALVPAVGGVVSADNIISSTCTGSLYASGSSTSGCSQSSAASPQTALQKLAANLTKWFSIIVGAISIIMIIYGGFRYITSGGDSGRVGSAKNTIIYAVIGLIVVALAQLIVNFVITQAPANT